MKVRPLIPFIIFAVGILLTAGVDEAAASDLAASLVSVPACGIVVPVTEKTPAKTCITINGDEFCLVKKRQGGIVGGQPQNGTPGGAQGGAGVPQNGTTGGGGAPGNNPATTQTEPGEHSCPAGYVVLDKPNKYGAFCEPKEGFPTTTPEPAPGSTGFFCEADVTPAGHETYAMAPQTAATEDQARAVFAATVKQNNNVITGPVTCRPN